MLVTRPAGAGADALAAGLRDRGFEPVVVPLIEIEPTGDEPVDVSDYDWVVVTSPNGARELRRRANGPLPRVAAIGRATADALGGADVVADLSTQEGLVAAMPARPGRVLFAGAEGARVLLPAALGADVLVLYRTRTVTPARLPDADLVTLASASAAAAFAALDTARPAVSIGPETTRAAVGSGVEVVAEAGTHDLAGLLEAVACAAAAIHARTEG